MVWRSLAVVLPMVKMLYPKEPRNMGHPRPYNSDAGAQKVGPVANPSTYNVTPNVVTSMLTPNWTLVAPTVDEKWHWRTRK
ncbi:hypothetical protein EYZ11_006446 [Aspergillus tanneri]|uniref:Uncharacterized protein n=1 Tax=Aspergillus tanneri TaxID=1220188 RepID=A0A4S3JFF2_9EURO|nr:hypothetical protein EYZ11_006446 [Aspergillus tanneri]